MLYWASVCWCAGMYCIGLLVIGACCAVVVTSFCDFVFVVSCYVFLQSKLVRCGLACCSMYRFCHMRGICIRHDVCCSFCRVLCLAFVVWLFCGLLSFYCFWCVLLELLVVHLLYCVVFLLLLVVALVVCMYCCCLVVCCCFLFCLRI